jgi:hypothetical protein
VVLSILSKVINLLSRRLPIQLLSITMMVARLLTTRALPVTDIAICYAVAIHPLIGGMSTIAFVGIRLINL